MTEVNKNDSKEDYEFIKEKIKEKPLNKRKLLMKIVQSVITGAVFGFFACLAFLLCKPFLEDLLFGRTTEEVVIPGDEEETAQDEVTEDSQTSDTSQTQTSGNEQPVQKIYNVVERVGIEISDYEELYGKLYEIANQVNNSMVTVTGITNDTDWFNNNYENKGQTSGLIFADNGKEYLILAESSKVLDVEEISVTFSDNSVVSGKLMKYDAKSGLAIISVAMEDMQESTLSTVTKATLGNSRYITQGSLVIAIGSPLGYMNSISYGVVTSSKNEIHLPDWNIGVLGTDIYGSSEGSGILINLKGEVIGFINQNLQSADDNSLLTFLSISDLKDIIEKLSNEQDLAYLGVKGMDITQSISELNDVPVGAYVQEVVIDSPAMYNGIQSGDVIVKIGSEEIKSFTDLEKELLKHSPEEKSVITVMRLGKDGYTEMSFNVTYGK